MFIDWNISLLKENLSNHLFLLHQIREDSENKLQMKRNYVIFQPEKIKTNLGIQEYIRSNVID